MPPNGYVIRDRVGVEEATGSISIPEEVGTGLKEMILLLPDGRDACIGLKRRLDGSPQCIDLGFARTLLRQVGKLLHQAAQRANPLAAIRSSLILYPCENSIVIEICNAAQKSIESCRGGR